MTFSSVASLRQDNNKTLLGNGNSKPEYFHECISIYQFYRIKRPNKHAYIRITLPKSIPNHMGWRKGDVINFSKKDNEELYAIELLDNPKLVTSGLILRTTKQLTPNLYTEYKLLNNDFFTIAPLNNQHITKYIHVDNLTMDKEKGRIIFSMEDVIESAKKIKSEYKDIPLILPDGRNNELKKLQLNKQVEINL